MPLVFYYSYTYKEPTLVYLDYSIVSIYFTSSFFLFSYTIKRKITLSSRVIRIVLDNYHSYQIDINNNLMVFFFFLVNSS